MLATVLEVLSALLQSLPAWFRSWGRCSTCGMVLHRSVRKSYGYWGEFHIECRECYQEHVEEQVHEYGPPL